MEERAVQILEIRAGAAERPVTMTAAISAQASRAIYAALSEELDRHRRSPVSSAEEVLAAREHVTLVDRFGPPAMAGEHSIVCLSAPDLHTCLIVLTRYADRVDGEYFQPIELRDRLRLLREIAPVLWDAGSAAAAAQSPELQPR